MQWTVSRRIVAGFAVGLSLVVVVVLVGVVALRRTSETYRAALDRERRTLVPALTAQAEFRRAILDFQGFLARPNDAELRSRDSTLALSYVLLVQLRDSAYTAEGRAIWAEALGAVSQWDAASQASMTEARAGRGVEAERIRESRAVAAREAVRAAIQRGIARAEQLTDAATTAAQTTAAWMQTVLLLAGLLALVVGTLSAVFLNRAVSGPLRETTGVLASSAAEILAATTQQASGASETSAAVAQTVASVDEVAQTAEVKGLAEQSKRATVEVRRILGEIQRATGAAVMTAEEGTKQVGTVARQVRDAVGEAAQAAAQIVASAGQQTVGMSQIRQAMANIHEATQQNLASTRQAERAAQDLDRLGRRLLALVQQSPATGDGARSRD
jgi:methyl-accepting chemotaxis protein